MIELLSKTAPLWLAAGLYIWQAWIFLAQGDKAMALVFVGYTVANFGLIVAAS